MLSKKIYTILLMVILIVGSPFGIIEAVASMASEEQLFFEKLNEARTNPLVVAESAGLDKEQVLADLPALRRVLTYGTPKLWYNEDLKNAAEQHSLDMMNRFYYSQTTPEGLLYEQRIENVGYAAERTGVALGVLAFYNFMGLEEAVQLLFENLFRDELKPDRIAKRNILNSGFQEVGVSIKTGTWTIGKADYNIVLVTCYFGTRKVIEKGNSVLLNLINQARANPLQYAASLGMDTEEIIARFPEWENILTAGLPPVNVNTTLSWTAGFHTIDMMVNKFYGSNSSNGLTFPERLELAGYESSHQGEITGYYPAGDYVEPAEAARSMFEDIFKHELNSEWESERVILSPSLSEIGVGFGMGLLSMNDGLVNAYLMACDLGEPSNRNYYYLNGRVYKDLDENGMFTPGEEISDASLDLEIYSLPLGIHSKKTILTGESGEICLQMPPCYIQVSTVIDGEAFQSGVLPLIRENQVVVFKVAADR